MVTTLPVLSCIGAGSKAGRSPRWCTLLASVVPAWVHRVPACPHHHAPLFKLSCCPCNTCLHGSPRTTPICLTPLCNSLLQPLDRRCTLHPRPPAARCRCLAGAASCGACCSHSAASAAGPYTPPAVPLCTHFRLPQARLHVELASGAGPRATVPAPRLHHHPGERSRHEPGAG